MARKRGTGSIYKRGSSWWIAFYHNGRQIRERVGPVGLITKGQAEQALKARMGESVQGRFNLEKSKKAVPFNKLLKDYLQWAETNLIILSAFSHISSASYYPEPNGASLLWRYFRNSWFYSYEKKESSCLK